MYFFFPNQDWSVCDGYGSAWPAHNTWFHSSVRGLDILCSYTVATQWAFINYVFSAVSQWNWCVLEQSFRLRWRQVLLALHSLWPCPWHWSSPVSNIDYHRWHCIEGCVYNCTYMCFHVFVCMWVWCKCIYILCRLCIHFMYVKYVWVK